MTVDPYGRSAVSDEVPRCWRCNRILALYVTRPWRIRCSRCKAVSQDSSKGPVQGGESE